MDTVEDLYSMKLHDRFAPNLSTMVYRVPGGWLYSMECGLCFVPFSNEFMTTPANKTRDGE